VAGARRTASPQVAHRFEAFQEPLPGLCPLQATAVPQPIACRYVTALDRFGRLATCAVVGRQNLDRAQAARS
jgi:hypothetical protein